MTDFEISSHYIYFSFSNKPPVICTQYTLLSSYYYKLYNFKIRLIHDVTVEEHFIRSSIPSSRKEPIFCRSKLTFSFLVEISDCFGLFCIGSLKIRFLIIRCFPENNGNCFEDRIASTSRGHSNSTIAYLACQHKRFTVTNSFRIKNYKTVVLLNSAKQASTKICGRNMSKNEVKELAKASITISFNIFKCIKFDFEMDNSFPIKK